MRVIICGAGRVGYGIAARLAQEKFDVTVIDQKKELVRGVTERIDVRGIVGNGSYPDILASAGAREADMMIAVTHSDEVNIVAAQIAHSVFDVPTKIARIRAQSYLDTKYADIFSRAHIPIDVIISPEQEVAEAVLQKLSTPGAFEIKAFADGLVWAVGVRMADDCPVLNTPLKHVAELFPELEITIVGIQRNDTLFRPHADDQLEAGDNIYFVADRHKVERALQILGDSTLKARRVILVGGGNIGLHVARSLETLGSMKIRMIEADPERASYAAEQLERTVVLQGDGLDSEILKEAGVADAETVVTLTNNDQINLLSAVIAKREGARRAMSLVNEPDYASLTRAVGIDRYVDPRATTISTILQHVRRGRIKGVFSLLDGQAELIDAVALDTSTLVGEPLKKVSLPSGVVIGALVRAGKVLLPNAETIVNAGDRVVLLALRENVKDVEQMFRVSLEYF
ncbi:Trk system potassium transporter TrkA [Parvularcula sp. IMCC14364]|uniref:Trk system potassium transporter TrkA n=1 Tax=Parvularcula sp. IMCC14364 TaxID=3067902 RepID=UPI002741B740|nr:Trk system potassium transporter TrkA [Parvularcula sp. IMCC14364]